MSNRLRLFFFPFLLAFASNIGLAQTYGRINEVCSDGAGKAKVQGMTSTNSQVAAAPSCLVTVYDHGTTDLATIYSDASGTTTGNPFNAPSTGLYGFYLLSTQHVDIQMSAATMQTTTIPDVTINGGGGGGGGNVDPSAIPYPKTYYAAPGSTVSPNPVNTVTNAGDEITKSTNANQAVGKGANTDINTTVATATTANTATGSATVPSNYPNAATDIFVQKRTQQFQGQVVLCSGTNGTAGTACSVLIQTPGTYASCPTSGSMTFAGALLSGSPATFSPVCGAPVAGLVSVTSVTVSANGGIYSDPGDNTLYLTAPLPPANAETDFVNSANGLQAHFTEVNIRSFCSVADGIVDNTDCIQAASDAAVYRSNKYGGGKPKLKGNGGDIYKVTKTNFRMPYSGDNGAAPPGNCNGAPCTALAPMTPAYVNCGIKMPQYVEFDSNGSTWIGPWDPNANALTLDQVYSMFCGDISNLSTIDMSKSVIINTPLVFNYRAIFSTTIKNIYASGVAAVIHTDFCDRSEFGNIEAFGFSGILIGGTYTSRNLGLGGAPTQGGYCDLAQFTGHHVYHQQGTYNDAAHPSVSARIPNRLTGIVPGGGPVSINHQWDDIADYLWHVSSVNPITATNSTAQSGMTFKIVGTPGTAGNAWSIIVDATTHSAQPYSITGTVLTVYGLDENGTNRTIGGLAQDLACTANSYACHTAATVGIDDGAPWVGFVVNVTGTPSTPVAAHASTPFTGGVNSTRLPDGVQATTYSGVAGYGILIESVPDRPNNTMTFTSITCEGEFRPCVGIKNSTNGYYINTIQTEGTGYCDAGSGFTFGSLDCPDPFNFFTTPSGSNVGPKNSAALYFGDPGSTYGIANEVDAYGSYAWNVAGRKGQTVQKGFSIQGVGTNQVQTTLDTSCSSSTANCNGGLEVARYSQGAGGNNRPNEAISQIIWDADRPVNVIGAASGNGVGLPTLPGEIGVTGIRPWIPNPPSQFPQNYNPFKPITNTNRPGGTVPALYLNPRHDFNCWEQKGTDGSWNCLALQGNYHALGSAGAPATYTFQQSDCGGYIQFADGGTLNFTAGVPTSGKVCKVTLENAGQGGTTALTVNWLGSHTGLPSSIPALGIYEITSPGFDFFRQAYNTRQTIETISSGAGATNTDFAGSFTLGGGGTATFNFTHTYSIAPVCVSSDTSAVAAVQSNASTTVLTLTGTAAHTVSYICVNREATP